MNVGGQAVARSCAALDKFPDLDLYAFVETRLTASACDDISVAGYAAHHCVRPEREGASVSGGITVLVREGSPLFAGGVRVRCDAATGIVWVEVPARELCMACCYFSPANSAVYNDPFFARNPVACLLDGLEAAKARGLTHHIIMGDLNCRIGTLHDDVPHSVVLPPLSTPLTQALDHDVRGIPARRCSCDITTHQAAAKALLDGLFHAACVVLNGRAPGDESGQCTCWKFSARSGAYFGSSVVDFGIVSVGCITGCANLRCCRSTSACRRTTAS